MIRRIGLSCLISLGFLANVQARPPLKLTINKAVSLSLRESDELKVTQIERDQAENEYKIARSMLLPKLSATAGYKSFFSRSIVPTAVPAGGGAAAFSDLPLKRKYGMNSGITVSQILFSFGQIYHGVSAANVGVDIKTLQTENKVQELTYQVRNAYWATVLSKKSWEISKKSYNNILKNKSILLKRYSNGRIPQSDLVKMDRDLSLRFPEVLRSENEYKMSLALLKYFLNLGQNVSIELVDDLELTQLREKKNKLKKMVSSNTSVQILEKKLIVDEHLIKKERASFLPTLSAYANYSTIASSEYSDFPESYGKNHYGVVGVQLDIPIFEGFKKNNSYSKALLEKNKTVVTLRNARKGLLLDLQNSYSEYQTYKSVYKEILKTVKLAQRTFNLSRKRFRTGQTTVTELNDAESMVTKLLINKELTLYKIAQLQAKIEKLSK